MFIGFNLFEFLVFFFFFGIIYESHYIFLGTIYEFRYIIQLTFNFFFSSTGLAKSLNFS